MGEYYYARVLFGPVSGELGEQLAAAAKAQTSPLHRPTDCVPPDDPLVAFIAAEGAEMHDTTEGVVFEISDEQANYGLSQWFADSGDTGLDTLLVERGIPFTANDSGRYEIPGRSVRWQPGMEHVHTVATFDGEPMLLLSEFKSYADSDLGRLGDPILLALIQSHFGLNLPPHPTDIAMRDYRQPLSR
jgi:hypothetical protein